MKTILFIGLVAIATFVLQSFFPWWTIAILPFLIGLSAANKGLQAFAIGFLGISLLWLIHASLTQFSSTGLMGEKVAALFSIPVVALLLVTALLGGLVGGFSGLTGFYLSHMKAKKR